jgi:hypothetical protein
MVPGLRRQRLCPYGPIAIRSFNNDNEAVTATSSLDPGADAAR